SLAMFMFSFFECFATVANVLQHNQLNVAFRRLSDKLRHATISQEQKDFSAA
ncbi:hypothetical protein ACJX0J_028868, partial [Zea mays]